MFQTMDSGRCFNIIDNIIVEETLRDNSAEGELVKTRARLNKIYMFNDQTDEAPVYEEPTENGFGGIPMAQ